jgi:hypothetical protein
VIRKCGWLRICGFFGFTSVVSAVLFLPVVFSGFAPVDGTLLCRLFVNAKKNVVCDAAQNEELFSVDVGKQKEAINIELNRIDELISRAKLQDARSAIGVLEHKIDRIRKSLAKDEIESFKLRIENYRKTMPHKEDSLVNKTMEILHTTGVDSALLFTQIQLKQSGVSDSKISAAEKRILIEAPAIKQAQEREQIARALKMLENGQLPDSTVDPYIVRTAQLMIKAHEDSVKRIDGKNRRKEMEEQERVERANMEREIQERKIENARLTMEKERIAGEKERQRRDSILEEGRKKVLSERKDSILTNPQSRQHETATPETNPAKPDKSATVDSPKPDNSATVISPAKLDKSLLTGSTYAKSADTSATVTKQHPVNADTNRKQINTDTIADNRKVVRKQSSDTSLIRNVNSPKVLESSSESSNDKSAQVFLQDLKGNQGSAQAKVMKIYDLMERKQCNDALDDFKQNRAFIARYVEAQVFNVLEQTVVQSVMDSTCTSSSGSVAGTQKNEKKISPEQEHYNRINNYMRDNNVDAAYAEFKRSEKQLKKSMTKDEFKQLKNMVVNSYKMRHPEK